MTHPPLPTLSPPADDLVLACLDHLQREQAVLASTLEALRAVRQRLLARDLDGLQQALAQHQQAAAEADDVAGRRRLLRQRVACELGLPEQQATLRALAERVRDRSTSGCFESASPC